MPVFSAEAAHAFIHAAPQARDVCRSNALSSHRSRLQEVRSENSRFAPPPETDPDSFVTEVLEGPLTSEVGGCSSVLAQSVITPRKVKGIGGVIEMLRAMAWLRVLFFGHCLSLLAFCPTDRGHCKVPSMAARKDSDCES